MTATPMTRSHTFHLIPKAETALTAAAEITGLSRNEVVNRALQAYAFLEEQHASGHELLTRQGDDVQKFWWHS